MTLHRTPASDDRVHRASDDFHFRRLALEAMDRGSESFVSRDAARIIDRAIELGNSELTPSSRKTYKYLVRDYERFCDARELDPFAPFSVVAYCVDRIDADEPKSTLRGRLASIRQLAKISKLPDPTAEPATAQLITNAFRVLRPRRPRRATPATYDVLETLVTAVDTIAHESADGRSATSRALIETIRLRDRALILFGFAIGRRGAELARIELHHLTWTPTGVLIEIPHSKTNRSGESETIGAPSFPGHPLCPVTALKALITQARIDQGPIFRTCSPVRNRGGKAMRAEDISRRLDAVATRAGLPGFWRSHSLRRGVVTSAERHGVARSRTNKLTGWTSDAMYPIYAEHGDGIALSPLHDIYDT